jgi:alanine-glyoxylate transaminase/serine-glyoxylate transaminase/serine-pyruvate transaminase
MPSRFGEKIGPMRHTGRHFLQIPGPTNVPDRILRAIDRPTIDHRGPEFAALSLGILDNLRPVFQTRGPVIMFPSSGTGGCEAALVNTLSPGDHILIAETGWFSHKAWRQVAERLGLKVEYMAGDWRHGVSPVGIEARLRDDSTHAIKAVAVVHNESSTGVTSRLAEIRRAINRAGHPALFLVDALSAVASIEYRHDEWEVDVTVGASQKGLMLPPGLALNAVSEKALAASKSARLPKSYWDWQEMLQANKTGFYPYTPPTNLLYGLHEALAMLLEEGLENVWRRHARHAEAARAAVRGWGLEILCADPLEYSNVLTAVLMPDGHNADALRDLILERFDMSLGTCFGKYAGKVFRIGHIGAFNDLMLVGTLGGVEMGLRVAGVPHKAGGILAALDSLAPAKRAEPVVSTR